MVTRDDDIPADDEIDWTDPRWVRRLELRYLLTDLLIREPRVWSVKEMVGALRDAGFELDRRTESASKLVSGSLRWEIGRGRVVRCGWGTYRLGSIPGSTRRRIQKRARQRRQLALERRISSATTAGSVWPR